MTTPAFNTLLTAARRMHQERPALQDFCTFPDDLKTGHWMPYSIPSATYFVAEKGWANAVDDVQLLDGFRAASADAQWRETYKETDIGQDFMNRFGCYCLIGPGAPWTSAQMYAFVVYMPAGLWYPWHEHPAEELYFVLAGEGEFFCEGSAPEKLGAGQSSFHASGLPHALQTHDSPLLAYVLWRNHFDTPPVWSPNRFFAPPDTVEP